MGVEGTPRKCCFSRDKARFPLSGLSGREGMRANSCPSVREKNKQCRSAKRTPTKAQINARGDLSVPLPPSRFVFFANAGTTCSATTSRDTGRTLNGLYLRREENNSPDEKKTTA